MTRALFAIGLSAVNALGAMAAPIEGQSLVVSNCEYRWRHADSMIIHSFDRRSPPVISFPNPKNVLSCTLDDKPCPASMKMTLNLDPGQLRPRSFVLKWTDGAGPRSIRIEFLNRLRQFEIKGRSELEEHIFFAMEGVIGAVNPNGELDYYRELDSSVIDFRPQTVGGKTYYTYGLIKSANIDVNNIATHVILDEKMEIVERHERLVDSHEFLLLGRKHYLFTDYQGHSRPSDEKCVLKQYLIEEKNGRDVYTLSTDDLIAKRILRDYWSEVPFNGRDCLQNAHLNGVTVIDSNRWLVSVGDGAIFMWLKKERRAEWVLGGDFDQFGLKPEQRTTLHHTPQWFDRSKSLLVFDNGRANKKSRLLEYVLDVKNKKVREAKVTPLENTFTFAGGSVEREGRVTSVGTGHWKTADHDFVELVDDKVTMTIRFCKSCNDGRNYRVYRGPFRK